MTPLLITSRLTVRRLTDADAPFILALVNEPSFIRNIGDRGVRTLQGAREYLALGPMASYERFGHGLCLVELPAERRPIGMCGILQREELPGPDLGFAFLPAYWSKGYALEAATAVRDHARDVLQVRRLLAIASPSNASSLRLLERLGFRFESVMRLAPEAPEVNRYACDLSGPVL